MSKTINNFDIFKAMNQADIDNNTRNIGLSTLFLEANKSKQCDRITMGAEAGTIEKILTGDSFAMFFIINKAEYYRLKNSMEEEK